MKNRILLLVLIFLSPFIVLSQCTIYYYQLDIAVNQSNNQVIIDGLRECNICEYGVTGATNCECEQDCYDEDYEDCYLGCRNEPYPIDQYYCQLECSEYYNYEDWDDYQSCFENCDEYAQLRTPISYAFAYDLWYTTSIIETGSGNPDISFQSGYIFSPPPNKLIHNIIQQLPTEPISYCLSTGVLIEYSDNSCCIFYDYICVQLG